MNRSIILEKLRTIKPFLAERYGVSEIGLFGSYSRNEQTQESDIDIIVDFKQPIGIEYINLAYELEELFKNLKVQVVSKKAIKPHYYERLKKDLIYA